MTALASSVLGWPPAKSSIVPLTLTVERLQRYATRSGGRRRPSAAASMGARPVWKRAGSYPRIDMFPTSLPGGIPGGITAARPTSPRAASRASVGIDATSSGVLPVERGHGEVCTAVRHAHDVLHRMQSGRALPGHRHSVPQASRPRRLATATRSVGSSTERPGSTRRRTPRPGRRRACRRAARLRSSTFMAGSMSASDLAISCGGIDDEDRLVDADHGLHADGRLERRHDDPLLDVLVLQVGAGERRDGEVHPVHPVSRGQERRGAPPPPPWRPGRPCGPRRPRGRRRSWRPGRAAPARARAGWPRPRARRGRRAGRRRRGRGRRARHGRGRGSGRGWPASVTTANSSVRMPLWMSR